MSDKLDVRTTPDILERIDKIVRYHEKNYSFRYDSRSHFIRCAIVKLLRSEGLEINARENIRSDTQGNASSKQ